MEITRREFAKIAGLGAAAGLTTSPMAWARRQTGADKGFFDWRPVGSGAWAGFNGGGNALVVRSAGAALLVDTKNPGFGDTLRRETIAQIGSDRLAAVILTHHHHDHAGGVPAFHADSPVYGHANAATRTRNQSQDAISRAAQMAERLAKSKQPVPQRVIDDIRSFARNAGKLDAAAFSPSETLEGRNVDQTIKVGALEVVMHHVNNGHTDNDVFVHIPELNLIHTGDLLFHGLHCYIDVGAGASTKGWENSVQAMIALCDGDTTVVPGHGEITDVSGLRGQIDYFQKLRAFVLEQRAAGVSRVDIKAMSPDVYEGRGFAQMGPANLEIMYDELEAGE